MTHKTDTKRKTETKQQTANAKKYIYVIKKCKYGRRKKTKNRKSKTENLNEWKTRVRRDHQKILHVETRNKYALRRSKKKEKKKRYV